MGPTVGIHIQAWDLSSLQENMLERSPWRASVASCLVSSVAPFIFVPVEYSTEGATRSKFNGLQHKLQFHHAIHGHDGHLRSTQHTFEKLSIF